MLKHRIITALILLIVVLAALFAPSPLYWLGLVGLLMLVAGVEWMRLCGIKNMVVCTLSVTIMLCLYFGLFLIMLSQPTKLPTMGLVFVISCILFLLWVLLSVFVLQTHSPLISKWQLKYALGFVLLPLSSYLLYSLHQQWLVFVLLFTVAAADIGAYFAGKTFGKTPLLPKVSPKKTVEGLFGGLALVAIVFSPWLFSQFSVINAVVLLLVLVVTALFSVMGDLFESKLKRQVGVKDSGKILPGHGGVLDRIDGLLAAIPVFYIGMNLSLFMQTAA